MKRLAILLVLAAAPLLAQTRVENAFRGAIQDRSSRSADEALFVEKCGMCHRQMGMGTVLLARRLPPGRAVLEARTDLTVDTIRAAVRQGIGNMPRVRRGELSDAQLDRIAAYLAKAGDEARIGAGRKPDRSAADPRIMPTAHGRGAANPDRTAGKLAGEEATP